MSLSPGSVRSAAGLRRLVLPSPNGATITQAVARTAGAVVGVSLRNLTAVTAWVLERLRHDSSSWVAVVAAGERRADGALRPAAEDLWGAGGFLAQLADGGIGPVSPEAATAIAAYRAASDCLPEQLRACASGRELIADGYPQDVEVAAEIDTSDAVPLLVADCFRNATA